MASPGLYFMDMERFVENHNMECHKDLKERGLAFDHSFVDAILLPSCIGLIKYDACA